MNKSVPIITCWCIVHMVAHCVLFVMPSTINIFWFFLSLLTIYIHQNEVWILFNFI